MDSLSYYAQVIEKAIAQIGLNPEDAKIEENKWTLKKGSVQIWVELYTFQNRVYFQVVAPVMMYPLPVPENLLLSYSNSTMNYSGLPM